LHGEVEAYNPTTNTWRSLPQMPTPRHGIWAAVIGNRVYIPGGGVVQGFGASNINEVFIVDPEVEIPLEITAIEFSGSNVLIKFRSQRNHAYLVERKDDLLFQAGPSSPIVSPAREGS
jgi:hypothetical protein